MLNKLLDRTVSVTMIVLLLLVLGIVSIRSLPVGLIPDIDIPQISVQLTAPDMSAREIDEVAVKPLRQSLMQIDKLKGVHSESKDGSAVITLSFDEGQNADFFYDFPEYQWQVVLFWWSGMMHMLNKRYPRVFKVQKVKKRAEKQSTFDIYSATIATMQKYVGVNEKECNNQSYSLVLEQMERMSRENEELERLNKKK